MRSFEMSLLVLCLALAACASPPGAQPPDPTVPPTEAVPATATAVPATATPAATVTPIGVATSTPPPGELALDWTSTSHDGQWTATAFTANLFAGETYYVRLRVEGSAGAQVWVPVDEWRPMGLGFTLPGLVQWSADGQTLFFTNIPHPDGCSLFVNGGDLQALELATGKVTEQMPEQALWVALSPDESRVAYIGYGQRGLIIRDLSTGQEQAVEVPRPAPDAPLGAIVWAPDGTALALTASHDPCGIDGLRSILHVDLGTGAARTLVADAEGGLTTRAWTSADTIELVNDEGLPFGLNVATGEVFPLEAAGE